MRDVPPDLAKLIKALPNFKSVTGARLREKFKTKNGIHVLHNAMGKDISAWAVLMKELMPTSIAELQDLDGCHIIPLADGSLGTLKLIKSDQDRPLRYLVASDPEIELFKFASEFLVPAQNSTQLTPVIENLKFNLAKLGVQDVSRLLELNFAISPTANPECNLETDKWLAEFWKFWNAKTNDTSLAPAEIDISSVKIFRVVLGDTEMYASPKEFFELSSVVESSVVKHQQLMAKIPGLYRFNGKFMPKYHLERESSLELEYSFYRFILALRLLAGDSGIEKFVKGHLDEDSIKAGL